MIISNTDLQRAYAMIREMYRDKGIISGTLRKIGFRNKWNYVLAEQDQSGLAFNFTGDHAVYGEVDDLEQFINLQSYIGRNLFEFVEHLLLKRELQMRSLCVAALNALSNPLTSSSSLKERGIPVSEEESYDFIKSEDIVTVIGYGGIVNQMYGRCKELHVNDMRPKHALLTLSA
ncbi:Molybdopterin biosynthesis enzyme (fragment) [Candidatus Desulfosporosinus infrequens]|uniref:Molybdopterin biosynthesis enzyme n=1 Tax=Candidatus Desulfosporosinus infrequens TaxID=2043169 RepID=A0A2U3JWY4_9FIRM